MALDPQAIKARRDKAWSDKAPWSGLYGQAFDYAIPYRRSALHGASGAPTREIYDVTATLGAARGAGKLREDLFGGRAPFKLTAGPLAKLAFERRGEQADLIAYERELEQLTEELAVHMTTGEFDCATGELCLDLQAGTGAMLTLDAAKTDDMRFARFHTLALEDFALGPGAYGDVGALYWRTRQTRPAILEHWPQGRYPDAFRKDASEKPYEEIDLAQDYVQDADGWTFGVFIPAQDEPIATETMRTRPFCSPRYVKVPGELYGRGPLLLSLGAIRTLNRVTEIALKSAALQMLGVWGYRPSAGVNPAALPLAPGAWWPMQSTGGVMGPDIFRLDTGGKEIQFASVMQKDLREQIREALNDVELSGGGKTPKSATEIMELVARVKANNVGAYGRLMHETTPVIVPRLMEVLSQRRVIRSQIRIDDFLARVMVTSPLAQAMRVEATKTMLEYVQVVGMTKGPAGIERNLKLDPMLDQIGLSMGVAAKYITTEAERGQYDEAAAKKQAAQMLAESVARNPKNAAEAAQIAGGDPAEQGRPNLSLVA